MRSRASIVLAATTAALVVCAPGAQGLAPDPGAPVTTPDTVAMYPNGLAFVDVLANDVDPDDPDNSQLQLCRLPTDDGSGEVAVTDLGGLLGDDAGTLGVELRLRELDEPVVVEYYVCDHSFLTRSTLTITMRDVAPVTVRKVRGKPGRLEVVNRNDSRVAIIWRGRREGGLVRLPADSTQVVRVHSRVVKWTAVIGHLRNSGSAGDGVVEGIRLPRHGPKHR